MSQPSVGRPPDHVPKDIIILLRVNDINRVEVVATPAPAHLDAVYPHLHAGQEPPPDAHDFFRIRPRPFGACAAVDAALLQQHPEGPWEIRKRPQVFEIGVTVTGSGHQAVLLDGVRVIEIPRLVRRLLGVPIGIHQFS